MCRKVECSTCKKPTYAGCGMHVEQVLGHVPKQDRCQCRQTKDKEPSVLNPSFWKGLFT